MKHLKKNAVVFDKAEIGINKDFEILRPAQGCNRTVRIDHLRVSERYYIIMAILCTWIGPIRSPLWTVSNDVKITFLVILKRPKINY